MFATIVIFGSAAVIIWLFNKGKKTADQKGKLQYEDKKINEIIKDTQLLMWQCMINLKKLQEMKQEELRFLEEMQELFKEKGDVK